MSEVNGEIFSSKVVIPTNKLTLDYLYGKDLETYQFYQTPKLLVHHIAYAGVDAKAKLLYGVMVDRAKCSATKGIQYMDEKGRIYIIFTIEEIEKAMWWSSKTAVKMIKQLDDIGLIERKRRGQGKATLIYVKNFATVQLLNSKKYNSEMVKSPIQELEKVQCSNTDLSNTNFSKTHSITHVTSSQLLTEPELREGIDDSEIKKEVVDELMKSKQLPYQYKLDERRMAAAIRFMMEWDTFYSAGYSDEFKQRVYNLFVEALIEMCLSDRMTLKGSYVTYAKVIDRINQLAKYGDSYIDLSEFSDVAISNFEKAAVNSEIKNPIQYMKSCIWDAMQTGAIGLYADIRRSGY